MYDEDVSLFRALCQAMLIIVGFTMLIGMAVLIVKVFGWWWVVIPIGMALMEVYWQFKDVRK